MNGAPTGEPVLVLGATGYLGQHICTAFAATGARVIRVSRGLRDDAATGAGDPARAVAGAAGNDTVHLDLDAVGTAGLTRLCTDFGARVVVNAVGAVWSGTEQRMTALNDRFVQRLTDAVAALPGRPRLIQLGSTHEYGPAGPDDLIDEEWPQTPTTGYGRTKLAGTRTVVRAVQERRVDGVVLRVSVSWGPGAPLGSLPGTVAAHLAAGHDVLRLAPLRAHRDVVDVRDVADAIVAAARVPRAALAEAGVVINIARGETVPVRELVDLMITCSGRSVRVEEERSAQANRSDALWQRLDTSRARRLLSWAPRRTLTDSVRDLLAAAGVPGPDAPHGLNSGTAEGRGKDST
ncbi:MULTISPECIES: NAD-dependent epimerase/dehydratase family protein [Streptomyces]|uniref:NAD-dependent epimerase/dehydratase family protein n=1 Tax=Streptomyces TaxID=1883 RepID=UPI001E37DCC9|nr:MULTISPECIES: NAD(P)-dependent oxidoreductase [Streptomyces]UFQ18664.1 NAD(P)-dependent oxidoreductase [Streptomyces huasconensis]WCL88279.1 NAD(P)-dependent oxidoreductase [Streptomyces sp. JCM 35825]